MMHDTENALDDSDAYPLSVAIHRLSLELLRAKSDLRQAEEALDLMSRRAERDALTGLPNRALFADRFIQAAAGARRNGHRMAVLFLDLDHFKAINDTHGHQVGDWVLKRASNCLMSAVRAADTVSRHGGDEFLILLSEITQASDAAWAANKVVSALAQAVDVNDLQRSLTASIGISIYPEDGTDLDRLIALADLAMYRNKIQRRGKVVLHAVPAVAQDGVGDHGPIPQARDVGPCNPACADALVGGLVSTNSSRKPEFLAS